MTPEQWEHQVDVAYHRLRAAVDHYASVNTALAAAIAREHCPDAEFITFDLTEDSIHGWGATLVTIRDSEGRLLWHLDEQDPGGIGDDSNITDRLATAAAWEPGHHPSAGDLPDEANVHDDVGSHAGDLRGVAISAAIGAAPPGRISP